MKSKKSKPVSAGNTKSKVRSPKSNSGFSIDRKFYLIIALFSVLLYANTLNHNWAFDDFPTIYGNSLTMSGVEGIPTMLKTAYWYGLDGQNDWLYRPLSLIMFAIEWELWPDTPTAGHIINVLLYALGNILMFVLLRAMFVKENQLMAIVCTLLFAVHPLHTEVVANIKSRDEILSMIFGLMAMLMVFRYIDKQDIKYLLVAGLTYFLSLFSKESAITFLGVFPLSIYFFR